MNEAPHTRSARKTLPPRKILPPALDDLAKFLKSANRFGSEITFWRGSGRLEKLRGASAELKAILLNPQYLQLPAAQRQQAQEALESLLAAVTRLMEAIPFHTKVGVLRRSLVPCYQEIFILRHLLQAVLSRIWLETVDPAQRPPKAGSLMDTETKRELQVACQGAAQFWRKQEWDVYDYL